MKSESSIRAIAFFALRFAIIAPPCLVLWWLILPVYVWVIGQLSAGILVNIADEPIDALRVVTDPRGVLNTRTALAFYDGQKQSVIEVAYIANNLPPFIVLILATAGMQLGRKLRALSIGSAVIIPLHILFIVLAYHYSGAISSHPEIPQALGKFMLTLPFVLWIVLAYWPKIVTLFETGNYAKTKG